MKQILEIDRWQQQLDEYAKERDWEQFHNPKNLAMALTVESAELMELFQWLSLNEAENLSQEKKLAAGEEMADILVYWLRLADKLGLDVNRVLEDKMEKNCRKYPVEKCKGSAKKYNEYD